METVYSDGDDTNTKARKHKINHTKNFFEKKKLLEEQAKEEQKKRDFIEQQKMAVMNRKLLSKADMNQLLQDTDEKT